jgi:hypothetical protein
MPSIPLWLTIVMVSFGAFIAGIWTAGRTPRLCRACYQPLSSVCPGLECGGAPGKRPFWVEPSPYRDTADIHAAHTPVFSGELVCATDGEEWPCAVKLDLARMEWA